MDFAYTPEDEAFRSELRGWLEEHLPKFLAEWSEDEHQADKDLLVEGGDREQRQAVLEDADDEGPDQGADDRGAAAEEVGAAEDGGGDGRQLVGDAG